METIIVTIVVVVIFALFAVMAIGPIMIEIRGTERKQGGEIINLPRPEPHGPADGRQAA